MTYEELEAWATAQIVAKNEEIGALKNKLVELEARHERVLSEYKNAQFMLDEIRGVFED